MAEMHICTNVCFIIVVLPSFGCEPSYQILTNSGWVQECFWVHAIQDQEIYLVMYMFATLSTCKLPNAVSTSCDFRT